MYHWVVRRSTNPIWWPLLLGHKPFLHCNAGPHAFTSQCFAFGQNIHVKKWSMVCPIKSHHIPWNTGIITYHQISSSIITYYQLSSHIITYNHLINYHQISNINHHHHRHHHHHQDPSSIIIINHQSSISYHQSSIINHHHDDHQSSPWWSSSSSSIITVSSSLHHI